MAQSSLYPIRYGLQVPPGENLKATEVLCEGGLDLTQTILEVNPSYASVLTNFEASLTGGYRRINGYSKYSDIIVPGQGQILGSLVYIGSQVLAARQDASDATKYNIYYGTGTNWTQINPSASTTTGNTTIGSGTITNIPSTNSYVIGQPISGAGIPLGSRILTKPFGGTSVTIGDGEGNPVTASATAVGITLTLSNPLNYQPGMVLWPHTYNWTGTHILAIADGVNYAYTWDGANMQMLYSSGAKANPSIVCEHLGYLMVSGYTENKGAFAISAPLNSLGWSVLLGAAEIVVGDEVVGLKPWRNQQYIFCKTSVHTLVGNSTDIFSSTPFTLQGVTDKIGCVEGRTIKEINGDLLFLAQDGLRTIAGTVKIGDTDVGSISRPIQSLVSVINPTITPCHALVIHKKTQYRLFYAASTDDASDAPGLMAAIRNFRNGNQAWEFAPLQGIKLSCCDSGFWELNNVEYIIHGGYDGYVYRQEQGSTFDGTAITENYTTVPFELGDRGTRKVLHRVTVYVTAEGSAPDLNLNLIYDLNRTTAIQPAAYQLQNLNPDAPATWDDPLVLWDDGTVYATEIGPIYRQNVQGSGFIVQLKFSSTSSAPYTIQGFLLEYFPAARR